MFNSKAFTYFKRIFSFLPESRKKEFFALIPLAFIACLSEVFVLAIISRLFNFLSNQPRESIPFLSNIFNFDPKYKIILLIISFILMSWISSVIKLYLRAKQLKLKANIWRDLSKLALKNLLSQQYEFFIENKSTDLSAKVLLSIERVAEKIVLPVLKTLSGLFLIISISIAVLTFGKLPALILILGLLLGFLLISLSIVPFIRFATKKRLEVELLSNTIINESLNSIIDVKLTKAEKFFNNKFNNLGKNVVPTIWKGETLPEIPRALIEPFGITLIFIIGTVPPLLTSDISEISKVIPFLATIAAACLKLTPPLQDTFKGYTQIRGGLPDLEVTLKLINLDEINHNKESINKKAVNNFSFPKSSLKLQNISYKYPYSNKNAISNLSLNIEIGSRVAFVGPTGSGKTTTANLILQLLKPIEGKLLLDDLPLESENIDYWQSNCAYVQQSFYLPSSSILENVAFAIDKEQINLDSVWRAIEFAKLRELVESLPKGLKTNIGESGIKLSGGQRQRLAIARAFYRNSKLLILDEATSALDNKTESEVMNSINMIGNNCTLIIIAHRLSTVRNSDKIFEFNSGKLINSGSFSELCKNSESFQDLNFLENNILKG